MGDSRSRGRMRTDLTHEGPLRLPLHESHDVHEAGGADHGLVREDGFHGLLHTVVRLQRGQKRLDFFPESYVGKRYHYE